MEDIEKAAPGINDLWEKNFREIRERDRETAATSRAYASKIEAGIRVCAVALGLTAKTRGDASEIAQQASKLLSDQGEGVVYDEKNPYTGAPQEGSRAIVREETLGLGLASMYQKAREQRLGASPQIQQEISNRLRETAKTLAEVYQSPTCRFSVRNKISDIAKQEVADEKMAGVVDGKESASYLTQALENYADKKTSGRGEFSGVIDTVSKLRNIGKVEKRQACKVSKKLREDGLKSSSSSKDAQDARRQQGVLVGN